MQSTPSPPQQITADNLDAYFRFRRALRLADQLALDDLFDVAKEHAALAKLAQEALPMEVMLLSMLLEEYKLVQVLRQQFDTLRMTLTFNQPERENKSQSENTTPGSVDPGFGFDDDPKGSNEPKLEAIQMAWYEEWKEKQG